jgi:hypothetical protein
MHVLHKIEEKKLLVTLDNAEHLLEAPSYQNLCPIEAFSNPSAKHIKLLISIIINRPHLALIIFIKVRKRYLMHFMVLWCMRLENDCFFLDF